jgi:adenylosuccinate synthase
MWLNQLQECKRGDRRHGSVGVGFGETIERSTKYQGFGLTVADLINPFDRMDKLVKLVSEYLPQRLADLNINPHELDEHLGWMYRNPDQIIDIFDAECDYFLKRIFVLDEDEALKKFDTLIFEGAQGLALDQEAPDFPHVTRSYTGIDNVLRVLDFAGIDDPIHLTYVTRPYLTRHGAGPLKREVDAEGFKRLFEVVDETNKPHEYQGSLRFAILDMDDAINRIVKDQFKIPRHRIGNITLMTTCLDQAVSEDGFPAVLDGKSYMFSNQVFGAEFGSRINAQRVILCHGEEDWMVNEFKFLGSNRLEVVFGDEE